MEWFSNPCQAAPTADAAMFFFMSNSLHFSAAFLGRIQLFQGIAELLGEPLGGCCQRCRASAIYWGDC